MEKEKCIICGGVNCNRNSNIMFEKIKCNEGFKFDINLDVFALKSEERIRISNLIVEDMLAHPITPPKLKQYVYRQDDILIDKEGTYNLFVMLKNYPSNISNRIDRSLVNFANRYPKYGSIVNLDSLTANLLFVDSDDFFTETNGLLVMLNEMQYLSKTIGSSTHFMISAKGWDRIEKVRSLNTTSKSAFIAISFDDKTLETRESIRNAISSCGFSPVLINEKEHNNQIVPEILFEIQKSKFVVVDVSLGNYGAYFEAGFGTALGKEVIVCCRSKEFNSIDAGIKPHFDISQKSMVIWEDFEDLMNRLSARIRATIR